jgi:transcriptional regulator with XRE-family HTH domain
MVTALRALLMLGLTILVGVISNEVFAWLPALTRRVVNAGSLRFRDPEMGERAREEWQVIVADIPGPLAAFVHAVSLFFSVRRTERGWSAGLGQAAMRHRLVKHDSAIRDFGAKLRNLRETAGLSIEALAAHTKISIATLSALERGQVDKVPQGIYVVSYLAEFARLVGLDPEDLRREYVNAIYHSCGLPPTTAQSARERVGAFWCWIHGHNRGRTRYYTHLSDYCADAASVVHWSFEKCSRCGDVGVLESEICRCERAIRKLDIDDVADEKLFIGRDYSRNLTLGTKAWRSTVRSATQRGG